MMKHIQHERHFTAWSRAAALVLGLLAWSSLAKAGSDVINLGSRRELFVDEYLIESKSGVELCLHHPTPKELVMHHDKPWEGNDCIFYTIFRDGSLVRMYYTATTNEPSTLPAHDVVIGYAESTDGLHWERPDLEQYDFNGSKQNNIIWRTPNLDNWSCFKDPNPAATADARYKGFHYVKKGLMAVKSQDGIHWSHLADQPVLTDGAFDSLNLAFWDTEQGQYRAYYRDFIDKIRVIKTATSPDFIHWTPGVYLKYPGSPDEQLYTNNVTPYYRAPQIYVGFPTQYIDRGWSDSMRQLPELQDREDRSKLSQRYGTALTNGLFMTSRDGAVFHRWEEAFIRPGPTENWVYGDNYQNWGLLETKSDLPGAPDELSIYVTEHHWRGSFSNLRRYTLRIDGFVSVNAGGTVGEFTTHPLTFSGKELEMNYSTSVAGSVRVEIQNPDGTPIPGYGLEDCPDIFGDQLGRVVAWKPGTDLSSLAGKPVRLRFVMRDADLYSIRFRP